MIDELLNEQRKLVRFISTILPKHIAKDIVQDSYEKLIILNNKNKIKNKNIKSLLYTIARNKALDELKRIKKDKNIIYFEAADVDEERLCRIEKIIEKGNINYDILLDQCNNMSMTDLSNKYNLSVGAIKSRLFHTKKKIKEKCGK